MKQFAKALIRDRQCFIPLQTSFPNLSEEKMEFVSFDGPLKINVEGYYFWGPVELK